MTTKEETQMSDEEFIKNEEEIGPGAEYCNNMTEMATVIGLVILILIGVIAFAIDHPDLINNFLK